MRPTIPPRIAASGEPVSPDILVVVGLVGWVPPVVGRRPSVPVVGVLEMVEKEEDEGEMMLSVEDAVVRLTIGGEGAVGEIVVSVEDGSVGNGDGEETAGEV